MKFRILFLFLFLFAGWQLSAQKNVIPQDLQEAWEKQFSNASEIVETYKKNHCAWNDCFMIWQSGEHVLGNPSKRAEHKQLAQSVPSIDLNAPEIIAFMKQCDAGKFTDHYYMLQALKKGDSFELARDGISMSTQFPMKSLNHNDYEKLKEIFSGGNTLLHKVFLEKMEFLFLNNGCPKEVAALRPIIGEQVADSPLKKRVMQLFKLYASLQEGNMAPAPVLKDVAGNTHTFFAMQGKVIVVDVWATWCCSCIEKMPAFMRLRDEFKDNQEIIFLTVSIDRKKNREKWLNALQKNNMMGMLNLTPDMPDSSLFEIEYRISGIPRYIVIDKRGKIVSAFAPSPGKELKQLIVKTLKQ